MVDDIIDTAGTACGASKILKDDGALEIYFFACHGLFSKNALENINNSNFNKVIVTNSIPHKDEVINNSSIDIIDISWLCSQAILRQINGESLNELYDENYFNHFISKVPLI